MFRRASEGESPVPKLVRLYIVNVAIGFVLSAIFVAALVWFNIAGLGHLVLETRHGWIGGLMLLVSNGVIFAGAQFAIAVMRLSQEDEPPQGGRKTPALALAPAPVAVVKAPPSQSRVLDRQLAGRR